MITTSATNDNDTSPSENILATTNSLRKASSALDLVDNPWIWIRLTHAISSRRSRQKRSITTSVTWGIVPAIFLYALVSKPREITTPPNFTVSRLAPDIDGANNNSKPARKA